MKILMSEYTVEENRVYPYMMSQLTDVIRCMVLKMARSGDVCDRAEIEQEVSGLTISVAVPVRFKVIPSSEEIEEAYDAATQTEAPIE